MKLPYQLIQKIAVFYVAIWSISPPLMIGTVYRLLALACVAVWFVLAILRGLSLKRIHCMAALFALAVAAIAYIQYGGIGGILKMIPIYMLVIAFVMAYFYKDRWEELSGLVPILMILYIIWNFNTINALIEDPTIARQIVRDDDAIYEYLARGIGGYELIYPQVCVWPAVVMWGIRAFKRRNWLFGVLNIVWIVSYVWLLFLAGYSIAICASLLGLIMLVFYKGKRVLGALIIALVLFIGGAILLLNWTALQNTLLETFKDTAIEDKILDLIATNEHQVVEGSILSRWKRYSQTLAGLLNYPIVGSLWINASGGHSALLDNFVKYGWWGGLMYAVMLYYTPNHYKKKLSQSPVMRRTSNAVLVGLVFVSILDSITYSFMFVITIVLCLLYENMAQWEQQGPREKKPSWLWQRLQGKRRKKSKKSASASATSDRRA